MKILIVILLKRKICSINSSDLSHFVTRPQRHLGAMNLPYFNVHILLCSPKHVFVFTNIIKYNHDKKTNLGVKLN